ncbi:MAG: UDP-N-acetylglucosamine 2-epimerase (non-hydrolyzing) [Thermoguttaceae bacterium]
MTRIAVFLGTRPEAIKLAPVIKALRAAPDFETSVVSTGQHREMLRQVTEIFQIEINHDLDVMQPGQTLPELTARLMVGIDRQLATARPDIVLVQGDTTTVFVAALACFYRHVPVGHVEAGLRTYDLRAPFPEEANRKLTGSLAQLHFAPTRRARDNLLREGIEPSSIYVTGNTGIDALLAEIQRQEDPAVARQVHGALDRCLPRWREGPFVLVTGHRRENFGQGFEQICAAVERLACRFPDHRFVYPVHLNPNVKEPAYRLLGSLPNVKLIPPQGYSEFVALMQHCRIVLTDSGGVQEEAPSLGKPVLIMREDTERPEGVEAGVARLVGAATDQIVAAVSRLLTDADAYARMAEAVNPYGDGRAAGRVLHALQCFFGRPPSAASPGAGHAIDKSNVPREAVGV